MDKSHRKFEKLKAKEGSRTRFRLKESSSQPNLPSRDTFIRPDRRTALLKEDITPNQQYFGTAQKYKQEAELRPRNNKLHIRLRTESLEYNQLHEKLSSIEGRINQMKRSLQKKRQQKERRDRIRSKMKEFKKIQSDSQKRAKSELKEEQSIKEPEQVVQIQKYVTKVAEKGNLKIDKLAGLVTAMPEPSAHHVFNTNPYSPRSNVYYVSQIVKSQKDPQSIGYDHVRTSVDLLGILSNFKMPSNEEVKKNMLDLPIKAGYENKKTVIFDLDETLIHCNENLDKPHHIQLPVTFPNGEIIVAGINIRPGAKEILKQLSDKFELIVFTASHRCYANVVIDYLDSNKEYVQHRLYREHCYLVPNGPYVKDLRLINRPMEKMVLIDNAAYSYAFQLDNGIPIIPYYQGQNDFELAALRFYLESKIFLCNDVRRVNKDTFKLHNYRNYKGSEVEKLIQELYINPSS